jgi:hypothetical protein
LNLVCKPENSSVSTVGGMNVEFLQMWEVGKEEGVKGQFLHIKLYFRFRGNIFCVL